MAQTLSTMTSGRYLAPADKATEAVASRLWAVLRESGSFRHDAIPDRLAPTEVETGLLTARLSQVERHLAPAPPAAIKRSVGVVKGLMASTAVDGQSAQAVLDGYAMVLAQYPKALVEDICTRFLDGRLGNRVYAPTPAEIAHECRNDPDLIAARAERYRLQAILSAEIVPTPTPAEQEEIQAEYRRYVDETGAKAQRAKGDPTVEPSGSASAEKQRAIAELEERRRKREAAEAGAGATVTEQTQAVSDPSPLPERGEGEAA